MSPNQPTQPTNYPTNTHPITNTSPQHSQIPLFPFSNPSSHSSNPFLIKKSVHQPNLHLRNLPFLLRPRLHRTNHVPSSNFAIQSLSQAPGSTQPTASIALVGRTTHCINPFRPHFHGEGGLHNRKRLTRHTHPPSERGTQKTPPTQASKVHFLIYFLL